MMMDLTGLTIFSTLMVLSLGARDTTQHVTVMVAGCVGMHVMYSSVMGQTENLAEGRPTDQSSTYAGESGVPAGSSRLAVDGTRDQTYNDGSCSHTDSGLPHWWRVDLQQSVSVSTVVIYNRDDCCGERLRDFRVEVGDSKLSEQVGYQECYYHAGSAGSVVTITCTTPVCGRYVRIIKRDDDADHLALCEVEVFGTVLEPDATCTTSTTDGTSTLTYQRVTMITNDETSTSPSTISTNRPSSLTTQDVTSTTTADLATDVSAGSASTTSTDGLTNMSSPKPDSSTADVTTAGSMISLEMSTPRETDSSTADVATADSMTSLEMSTSQDTDSSTSDVATAGSMTSLDMSTPRKTDSSTADVATAGSMTSLEMSTSQETDSSTADVATAGSMISRETSTAQTSAITTHASSTQTRNPSTTGNVRETLPTKLSRSCQCVLTVTSNTTERTVTAVVKNMNEVKQSLLVSKTQTGKTIRKKTSAEDERTSSKIGGFAAVVFLASVCAFLFSSDCLALIGYCRTLLKRRKATSP